MEFETNPLTGRDEPVKANVKRKRGRPRKVATEDLSDGIPPEHVTDEVVFPTPDPTPVAPSGPYTVWYWDDRMISGGRWRWRDFENLQAGLDWPHKGSVYCIVKPVKYEVRELPESNVVPFVPMRGQNDLQSGRGVEELSGPPTDPDNPDSGPARYV